MGITRAQFNELGISFTPLAMPIVYVESNLPKIVDNQFVNSVGKILDQTKFSLLMHSRLVWSPETCDLSRILAGVYQPLSDYLRQSHLLMQS